MFNCIKLLFVIASDRRERSRERQSTDGAIYRAGTRWRDLSGRHQPVGIPDFPGLLPGILAAVAKKGEGKYVHFLLYFSPLVFFSLCTLTSRCKRECRISSGRFTMEDELGNNIKGDSSVKGSPNFLFCLAVTECRAWKARPQGSPAAFLCSHRQFLYRQATGRPQHILGYRLYRRYYVVGSRSVLYLS
ncbi:MAG: hypothetical protein LiPW39_592 [Parcubacteria group bacterium LiPW_39]|nr:MAG: hypothetical protein LiPW39_592 [Parcubacteria group bacterium LiPW_39]